MPVVVLALPFYTLRNINFWSFAAPNGFFQALLTPATAAMAGHVTPVKSEYAEVQKIEGFENLSRWETAFCFIPHIPPTLFTPLFLHYRTTRGIHARPEESIFIHHLWKEERR